jgi:hypothetical protein
MALLLFYQHIAVTDYLKKSLLLHLATFSEPLPISFT